jgi:hypothetical protein
MPVKKLDNLLASGTSGSLDKLVETARNMDVLTGAMKASLDADLASSVLAANLRDDGQLVIICASSAWASRLRFETDTLRAAAIKAGFDADSVRVSVSRDR